MLIVNEKVISVRELEMYFQKNRMEIAGTGAIAQRAGAHAWPTEASALILCIEWPLHTTWEGPTTQRKDILGRKITGNYTVWPQGLTEDHRKANKTWKIDNGNKSLK